jgi:hypothetical protein
MKALLFVWMIFFATFAWANEKSARPALTVVKGEVLEVRDVESYSYLRLKTHNGEIWAAIGKARVQAGDQVTIENAMVMNNFESKSLKKTFKTILFGTLAGASGATHAATTVENVNVARAVGDNAQTVEEIVTRGVDLKDKPVLLRGKVVKYNSGIMGRNWIHLRDGSGSTADNDIIVTTADQAKVGDVVTVKGVVRTDRDFGSGYIYKVIIEDATLQ